MVKLKPHAYGMNFFLNSLLDHGCVVIKVDPSLFMYKTLFCVVYVNYCLFW